MAAHTHYLWFETKRRQELIDITDEVERQVTVSGIREGFALVSAMHISASVFVNDHESGLWQDILAWLEGTIAPWDPERYRHNETGEDNAAAHLHSLARLRSNLRLHPRKRHGGRARFQRSDPR